MADGAPPVRVESLTIELGGRIVLDDVSLECAVGEWVVVVGPSGRGKTTLLRAINGLEVPTRGMVWTLGTPIPGRSSRQARTAWRQTGTVLQDIALFHTRSVRANVELGLRGAGFSHAAARAEANAWLERLGLGGRELERPHRLSGGQRQRVALARALAPQPRLLLLDEPTSALDRTTARTVLDAVTELVRRGTSVVMSSHRVDEVRLSCDRVLDLGGHAAPSSTESPRDGDPTLHPATPGGVSPATAVLRPGDEPRS